MHGWVDDRNRGFPAVFISVSVQKRKTESSGRSRSNWSERPEDTVPLDLESVVCPSHDRLLPVEGAVCFDQTAFPIEPVPAQARTVPALS